MSTTKIKINNVNSLTDARYFAAMGVDYLGFCCDIGTVSYCSPARIKEITDWIQGPQFVMEIDGWQTASDVHSIINTNVGHAVHFGVFASYREDFGLPVFKDFIVDDLGTSNSDFVDFPVIKSDKNFLQLNNTEILQIQHWITHKNVFLDIPFENDVLSDMLQVLPAYGIVLKSCDEEKVGLKSFEQLDEIFELLNY